MTWPTARMGEHFRVKHGYAFKGEYFASDGPYVLLTPGSFNEEGGYRDQGQKSKFYTGDVPEGYVLEEDDLLVAMTEQAPGLLGSSAWIPEGGPFLHNQRLGRIVDLDERRLNKRFLYYLFNTRDVRHQISATASGGKVRHTAPERIGQVKFRLPPPDTQRRIADSLSAYDDLIENNRRRIALLEEAARQLYREWFVRLRFPGHEHTRIANGVPEGWDSGTIADFFDTTSGGTPSRANPDFYTGGDINWVKTQELNDDFIFETEERITEDALARSAAKLFPANTLLLSIYGGTNIGRTGILAEPAATNQACCALFPKDPRAHFIFGALYFREQREHLIALAQGAAQTNISQQVVRALAMHLAPATIMNAFTETLFPAFDQMKTLERQNEILRATRDLLLPRLMSGEIAV
ncbi:MAG: restriction endonuclease subunit S [Gammaproteobacteria bacterium]